jgi:uncharacterized protein YdeI (YjbR/CyaY-like superfamily)
MDPVFFSSPEEFGDWLEKHHATEREVHVGYWKKHTGRPTLTWPQSVDEALCYGWIDGIRRSIDADRYTIRFTPRKPASNWSAVNIARVAALTAEGRMRAPGLAAFERRTAARSAIYAYENRPEAFDDAMERAFRKNRKAWAFWETLPPGLRKTCIYRVVSAKTEETRLRRLSGLIDACARGERPGQLTPAAKTAGRKGE